VVEDVGNRGSTISNNKVKSLPFCYFLLLIGSSCCFLLLTGCGGEGRRRLPRCLAGNRDTFSFGASALHQGVNNKNFSHASLEEEGEGFL
jgi:hypothetical protein